MSAALAAAAATEISNIVVNQRWPWNEKVDVDFILSGDASDVDVTAIWDSHPEPCLLGTILECAPGKHRFTWDPATSAFSGQTLTGFTVAVAAVSKASKTYLVLDLANGGYSYLPDVPEGGWTDEHKSSKMVFRRIPAGTYTLGEPKSTFTFFGLNDSAANTYATLWNRRSVIFTSDFYIGVFKYTEAQHNCLADGIVGSSFKPKKISYYSLRGGLDDADWPLKGYNVAADSIVAKLRAKTGGELKVDLCEEEQWEVAARAGTTTILPNGITTSDSLVTFTNKLNEISAWYGTIGSAEPAVGGFAANVWGLYDVVGLIGEWMLDSALNNIINNTPSSLPKKGLGDSENPVGDKRYDDTSGYRIFRTGSANWEGVDTCKILPCARQMANPNGEYTCSTRFCIHLKPLGNLTFE